MSTRSEAIELSYAGSPLVIEDGSRFDVLLEARSKDRDFGKRDRTRFAVMASVARQLSDNPSRNPAMETVLDETGLSRGTFYNNFTDMDDAVGTVLSAFFQALWTRRSRPAGAFKQGEDTDAVYEANLWYCRAYETNAGLFAAFTRVASYTPTILRMREEMNAAWVDRVISASSKKRLRPLTDREHLAFQGALRLMIAMSIEALRERYVHLDSLLSRSFPDSESMARGLTDIWNETIKRHTAG
ncbi:TetR/AcrR family transcriptional regulator (plasmid) [Cupriavidus sp. P-10]|uniref:TetR/AcrR family transcriptional regulator n=1 Tax=Cupriavidus sp. P-10 TaxID=2027911 RepID=UPI0011C0E6B6|nr:TetR/AcrR family transcriptional regulator [Cupriavidus sp. P-10]BDB30679.1 TetR/AcrR family transcriptional regulator [Cupriavidus sp. P-10]